MNQDPHARKPRGEPLSSSLVGEVRALLESVGEDEALRRLRVSRNALYRALASMRVLHGTRALIAEAFRSSAGAGDGPRVGGAQTAHSEKGCGR